ncbi:hypothetical protein CcaCcLH18_07153 [Colletotrichum camelliae]|nr:hypothetical protein CcaCcLH18_07153 [Colletotrichum camelliae]
MATQADVSATEQPNDPIILASYDDLTDHEKSSCDPIISHLLTITGQERSLTTQSAQPSGKLSSIDGAPLLALITTYPAPDVPSQEISKKHVIAGQEPPPASAIPKERRQGATVWLQPVPNFVKKEVTYKWTDSNNKAIGGAKFVSLTDKTLQGAKVEAMIKRDQKELDRLGRLNIDVAIYYARQQLLAHLGLNRRDGSRKGHKRCKACKTREVSDMKEFQEIRLCGDFIEAHKGLSAGYFAHEKQPLVGPSPMQS